MGSIQRTMADGIVGGRVITLLIVSAFFLIVVCFADWMPDDKDDNDDPT